MLPSQLLPFEQLTALPPLQMADYFSKHAPEIAVSYHRDDFTKLISNTAKALAVGAQMDDETPEEARKENERQLWTRNHLRIMQNVTNAVMKDGVTPPVAYIANELNLTRPQVVQHLADVDRGHRPDFTKPKFEIIKDRALAELYRLALNADNEADKIKAIKLLFDITGTKPAPQARTQNTVNILQVKNTNISLERIAQLPPTKQAEIAEILLTAQL